MTEPDRRFEALLPAADDEAVWAVPQDGRLRKLDIDSGRTLGTLRLPDEIRSGSGAPDGSVAAISGERGLWLVSLASGERRLVRIPDCLLGRPTFMSEEVVYLPCLRTGCCESRSSVRPSWVA